MKKLIAVMGLLVSLAVGQSTTVHDEINHTNTTVSCGSNGDCRVYDQDKADAASTLNKTVLKWCKKNHIPHRDTIKRSEAAFPNADLGFGGAYATEGCWETYNKSGQVSK